MTDGTPILVLLAEERPLFRSALRASLEAGGDIVVVAEAGSTQQATADIRRAVPDVAVVAANLPPTGGIGVSSSVKASDVSTRILIVSEEPDEETLVAAVEAGADGYIDWGHGEDAVRSAVRRLHRGEACIPPGMLGVLLRSLIRRRREDDLALDRFSKLTRREREVLALMVEGMDNPGIARALVVSPNTARTHVQNVLTKLRVHSRLEAAALAMEHQLITRFMEAT